MVVCVFILAYAKGFVKGELIDVGGSGLTKASEISIIVL